MAQESARARTEQRRKLEEAETVLSQVSFDEKGNRLYFLLFPAYLLS